MRLLDEYWNFCSCIPAQNLSLSHPVFSTGEDLALGSHSGAGARETEQTPEHPMCTSDNK